MEITLIILNNFYKLGGLSGHRDIKGPMLARDLAGKNNQN